MVRTRANIFFRVALVGLAASAMFFSGEPAAALAGNEVMIIELEGAISPGNALYVTRGLEEARKQGAKLCILRLDTPGGLGSSMRTIVKAILNSPVPVAVYV
ncbi:MAG: hypothetical protein H8E10_00035 [Desulfobacterales bacterium]|nr:hypothetical protein [Desulfobacterales bacterium]